MLTLRVTKFHDDKSVSLFFCAKEKMQYIVDEAVRTLFPRNHEKIKALTRESFSFDILREKVTEFPSLVLYMDLIREDGLLCIVVIQVHDTSYFTHRCYASMNSVTKPC